MKHRPVPTSLLSAILIALLASPAFAAKPAPLELPERELDAYQVEDGQRTNLRTGAPEAIYEVGFEATPDTPERMAREYLKADVGRLHLDDPLLADLQHRKTQSSPIGSVVRFEQSIQGIPVLGGRIAVTITAGNKVVFVANEYRPGLQIDALSPVLQADEARTLAADLLDVQGSLNFDRTRLAFFDDRGRGRLVYEVMLVPAEKPVGEWEVLVDALTGEIVSIQDRAAYAMVDGSGFVFDPDPLTSATATYGDTGFVDGGDATTTQLDGELFDVTLNDIDLTGGTYSLDGARTKIVDSESPFKGLFSQATSAFEFNRFDDAFEAVNTYYHVDHYMAYLNETLGLGVLPGLNGGVVIFDPHGLSGSDNSHYVSSTELIAFGEGGVDDAEDSDVVIHELGHGLHDWAAGCISQSNGLSEGIGDYAAAEYNRFVDSWVPGDPAYNWVFRWDGHNPFWGGRITNYTDTNTWPAGTGGGCLHTCGQYWSSSMMDIFDEIGRDATARAHWTGIMMTGCSATHEDAANAVLVAAASLGYPVADVQAIFDVFTATGYTVTMPDVQSIFVDDFETGDTTQWSSSVGEL